MFSIRFAFKIKKSTHTPLTSSHRKKNSYATRISASWLSVKYSLACETVGLDKGSYFNSQSLRIWSYLESRSLQMGNLKQSSLVIWTDHLQWQETHAEKVWRPEEKAFVEGDRYLSVAPWSLGYQEQAGTGKGKQCNLPVASAEVCGCQGFNWGPLASKILMEEISVVVSCWTCGKPSQQPRVVSALEYPETKKNPMYVWQNMGSKGLGVEQNLQSLLAHLALEQLGLALNSRSKTYLTEGIWGELFGFSVLLWRLHDTIQMAPTTPNRPTS